MNLTDLSLSEISKKLNKRECTAIELLDEYLNIALKGSCITFCDKGSFEAAKNIDRKRFYKNGLSPLGGIPFSVKDNIKTKGVLTSCNSRSLKEYIPDRNALAVQNLIDYGGILTAKNCMREFSVGKIEDSAFELRNYIVWASTNANANIGAFSIGTDIGMCDFFCGQWTFKPSSPNYISTGIITGSPSLEKITVTTRKPEDLEFIVPFLYGKNGWDQSDGDAFDPSRYKILVYDNLNMSDYVSVFLSETGFDVYKSLCPYFDKAKLIYDCIMCTDFFTHLLEIGAPDVMPPGDSCEKEYLKRRIEGFGFETKKNILKGAHLLSDKNKSATRKVLDAKKDLAAEMTSLLKDYDFIAAPLIYGDSLSKASAITGLAELTVPFGDVLAFKLITEPKKQYLLLDIAVHFEKRVI